MSSTAGQVSQPQPPLPTHFDPLPPSTADELESALLPLDPPPNTQPLLLDGATEPADVSNHTQLDQQEVPAPADASDQMPPNGQDVTSLTDRANNEQAAEQPQQEEDEDDASGSDHQDSEDEEASHTHWQPIDEDRSVPCTDELKFIEEKGEHSALDHAYWESKAFFDLEDPELLPSASGRIDWLVDGYNGTKTKPNNENIMRSQVVNVGGLDWQIKFYPKGNDCDFPSLYIECPSMKSPEFAGLAGFEDFENPPFPFLQGTRHPKKRRSFAVQLGVVMYNPAEPRTNEYQGEAHQFHNGSSDFGWKYFTQDARYDFHVRRHGQRQAILRDDKLAFSAYIRIVQDPTGCLWQSNHPSIQETIATTGLRPFTKSLQYIAIAVPLLHFTPFRRFVHNMKKSHVATWLQELLLKMYTRKYSSHYGSRGTVHGVDAVEMLWRLVGAAQTDDIDNQYTDLTHLIGPFHANQGSACGSSRLNTIEHASVQEAVTNHTKVVGRPPLLTLELQRQEHDKKERKWKKLTNKVKVEDHITVGGISYTLFAFITHCGDLQSFRYNSYVRPQGIGKGWYAYQQNRVTRLTENQARLRHSGTEDDSLKTPEDGYDSPFSQFHEPMSEVTYVVMYVRDDVAADAFEVPIVESWLPPSISSPQEFFKDIPKTAIHEDFSHLPYLSPAAEGQQPVSEEEYARMVTMQQLTNEAAVANSPQPQPFMMDGEDVVMKDAGDDSDYSIDSKETEPVEDEELEVGTVDWLGRDYYEGKFKRVENVKRYHGGGHLIFGNGDEYLGEFHSGLHNGFGKMIYAATGDTYEGEWCKGERHGRGKLTEASTGNVYDGLFQEGRKHGEFVLKGTVTEEDKSCCSICYDKEMTTAFYDCGHVVACRECANQIDTCPVCRRRVIARLQLFGVRISSS